MYQAKERGIRGPFDRSKWRKIPVVEPEKDINKFDTLVNNPTYFPSLRYSFAELQISDVQIRFNITSFVSPFMSRLDQTFFNNGKSVAEINAFNIKFTTSKGVTTNSSEIIAPGTSALSGLNTAPRIPIYNLPLSYLRSFGFWEALKDRIKDRAKETLSTTDSDKIKTKIDNAFDKTFVKIPNSRDLEKSFDAYKHLEKFTKSDWDTYRWDP